MDGFDKAELIKRIGEQGELIEELQADLNELISRRVPIAISESATSEHNEGGSTVICDDGSIWTRAYAGKKWYRLPDIPQPEKDDDK